MTADKEPVSRLTVEQRGNGKYFFSLTFRGVTYPAKGPFSSALQATAAGQAAMKALDAQAGGRPS